MSRFVGTVELAKVEGCLRVRRVVCLDPTRFSATGPEYGWGWNSGMVEPQGVMRWGALTIFVAAPLEEILTSVFCAPSPGPVSKVRPGLSRSLRGVSTECP